MRFILLALCLLALLQHDACYARELQDRGGLALKNRIHSSSEAASSVDSAQQVDFWANVPEHWDSWENAPLLLGRLHANWRADPGAKQIIGTYRGWGTLGGVMEAVIRVRSFDGHHVVMESMCGTYQGLYEGDLRDKSINGTVAWTSSMGTHRYKWQARWTGGDDWPVKYTIAEAQAARKAAEEKEEIARKAAQQQVEVETIAKVAEKIASARLEAIAKQQAQVEQNKKEEEQAVAVNRPVKDKWALIVGISKFADPSINLRFAAKDALDFRDYLIKDANFAPDHVRMLIDSQATREHILEEFGDSGTCQRF